MNVSMEPDISSKVIEIGSACYPPVFWYGTQVVTVLKQHKRSNLRIRNLDLALTCFNGSIGDGGRDFGTGRDRLASPPVLLQTAWRYLRKAFDETMKEPELLVEAATRLVTIRPQGGAELERQVRRISELPQDVLDRVAKTLE